MLLLIHKLKTGWTGCLHDMMQVFSFSEYIPSFCCCSIELIQRIAALSSGIILNFLRNINFIKRNKRGGLK